MKTQSRASSYAMLISSMLIYGTIGIFRRSIPLSSGVLACARGFLGSLVLLIFILIRGKTPAKGVSRRNLLLLCLNGAMIGFNWMLLFEAFNYTSVSTATLCYYMQPTIVILLSPIFFRERLTGRKLVCVALSAAGMVLVSGLADGGSGEAGLRGILLGLGAAALYASVIILNKKIEAEDTYIRTIVQLLAAAVVLVPYLLLTEDLSTVSLSGGTVILLLVVGVVHTGIAYALYFAGMKALPAQSIAILSYLDPVSALILSAVILGERLTVFGIIGAVLIIGAAMLSELGTARTKEKTE